MRLRALPTLQSKESALRMEVRKARDQIQELENELEKQIGSYDKPYTIEDNCLVTELSAGETTILSN